MPESVEDRPLIIYTIVKTPVGDKKISVEDRPLIIYTIVKTPVGDKKITVHELYHMIQAATM